MKKPKKQSDLQAAATAQEAVVKTNYTPSKHAPDTPVNPIGDVNA